MLSTYRRAAKSLLFTTPLLVVGVGSIAAKQTAAAPAVNTTKVGLVCTIDANHGTHPVFDLATNTGYINLPDGNTMFMWGYNQVGKPFQHPGPVLCVNEGDTVTVKLTNSTVLPDAASIAFPGQTEVMANGALAQPEFDNAGNVTSLTKSAAPGSAVTYSFTAGKPGTYIYQSGTNPEKQIRLGLFGALIVYPTLSTGGGSFAYDRTDSQYTPTEEFLVLLSEIDPYQHTAAENNEPFDLTQYKPRYWLINGRGFPDSVADNFASFLPSQPYGSLARIHEFNATPPPPGLPANDPKVLNYHPYPGLARYINVGSEDYPFHPHGNNGAVIARDGEPLAAPAPIGGGVGADLSFEKFSINVGPGQTWDVLVKWYDAEHYNATTNPVPVVVPSVNNQVFGMFYSGSPYLGDNGTLPPGMATRNQCGEFYVIAHNHALYQITSWGVTMTGPITYMRVDPPLPNRCPN